MKQVKDAGADIAGMFDFTELKPQIDNFLENNAAIPKILAGTHDALRLANRLELGEIPHQIFDIAKNIKKLDISHIKLRSIPQIIEKFENLEMLFCNNNEISEISPKIGSLANLQKLRVISNKLNYLPSSLGLLLNLQELDVTDNQLESVPLSLGVLPKLTVLKCDKNRFDPQVFIPKKELDKGDQHILEYLRSLYKEGKAELNRVKLMFVGNGNVGKTTLLSSFKKVEKLKKDKKEKREKKCGYRWYRYY